MKKNYSLLPVVLLSFATSFMSCKEEAKTNDNYLPDWQEGYMDIHQIATGRGNAAFAILPDGTTLLIDVGDLGDRIEKMQQEILPPLPNDSKLPGEWVSIYIKNFTKPLKRDGKLDYAFLTHYHNDHMGHASTTALVKEGRDFLLSGITELAEYLPIDKMVDRGYPDHNYPSRKNVENSNTNFHNYEIFQDYQQKERGTKIECFEVGSDKQFTLQYQPEQYPDFTIRNLYSAGTIWTGNGYETAPLFPAIETLDEKDYPNENICSSAIKISYGKFDYFTGGDITGSYYADKPWRDVETPVSKLVGPVEVAVLPHHGYSDAVNENFVRTLRPQVFIIPAWDFYHPQPEPLQRAVNRELYPEDRQIFSTGLVEGNRERMGELSNQIMPTGHIVTRVFNKGEQFQLFVLDATSTDYEVIYKSEIFTAK